MFNKSALIHPCDGGAEAYLHAFNFGVRWEKLSTPIFGPLIQGNNIKVIFYRRLGRPQRRSRHSGGKKNHYPHQEYNPKQVFTCDL